MEIRKVFKNVSFVFLLLQFCIVFTQGERIKKRIVIDPGHGGFDSGAIGINGLLEKDIVLSIAEEIVALNKKSGEPLDIYLTRHSDTLVSLLDRTRLSRTLQADLFLSLHCNHSDNPDARGVEVYVAKKHSEYADDATWFAFQLQDDLNKNLGFESRGVKFANFKVLRETISYCISILLELGFLSSCDEADYFMKPKNIEALALAVLMGVPNY